MGQEIERKFLVNGDDWQTDNPALLRQGYLASEQERSVRIRTDGVHAYITIKGKSHGATRAEYEYLIPLQDANELLDRLCARPLIEKRRHIVEVAGKRWEVDEFLASNAGLVVAEIELTHEHETFEHPAWLGQEVTHDPRYLNANLVANPFPSWS